MSSSSLQRILDDSDDDDAETFTLTLSSPSNGHLEDGTATWTGRYVQVLVNRGASSFGD